MAKLAKLTKPLQNRIVGHGEERVDQMLANPLNFRLHPANQQEALAGAIDTLGFIRSVTVNKRTGRVVDGHLRVTLAARSDVETLPVEYVDLDEAEEAQALLSLDPIAALAASDKAKLDELMRSVQSDDARVRAMLAEMAEREGLEYGRAETQPTDAPEPQVDRANELQAKWNTHQGQLWQMGNHRMAIGDSSDVTLIAKLLDGEKITLAFTSPPYAQQRDYDESSGFKPIHPDKYVLWFKGIADNVKLNLAHNGSWFVNIKPAAAELDTELYVFDLVITHVREWGWHFVTEFCWERAGIPKQVKRRFKNQFEPIYQFSLNDFKFYPDRVRHESDNVPKARGKGVGATTWKKHQGGESVFMSGMQGTPDFEWFGDNVGAGLAYPGNRLPTFASTHEALGHAAAFPVGLPQWFVKAYSDPGDIVYDPFGGSGSTLIAAENEGRKGRTVELSPAYSAIILQRWSDMTGKQPVLLTD